MAYQIVDGAADTLQPLVKDQHWNGKAAELPYTEATVGLMNEPQYGSAINENERVYTRQTTMITTPMIRKSAKVQDVPLLNRGASLRLSNGRPRVLSRFFSDSNDPAQKRYIIPLE